MVDIGLPQKRRMNGRNVAWLRHGTTLQAGRLIVTCVRGTAGLSIKSSTLKGDASLQATDAVSATLTPGQTGVYNVPRNFANENNKFTRLSLDDERTIVDVTFQPANIGDTMNIEPLREAL